MVSEELPTVDALSGCRGVTDRISFLVAEKIDGGCPFWFQSSYQWRMPFLVAEELQMENVLSCCREATDGGCPFLLQRVTDGECP